jgi:hypothetical protein
MTSLPLHPPPDLSTREGRAAYRRELLAVARKRRLLGFVAILLGAGLVAWPRVGGPWMFGAIRTQTLGFALLLTGFSLFAWVIAKRRGHHNRRMRPHGVPITDGSRENA